MTTDELVEIFEFLDGWEERYGYLIDIGRKLPEMPDSDKTEANRVRGCVSQVWMISSVVKGDHLEQPVLEFLADSDAIIVKGLIALLLNLYSGQSPQKVLDLDIGDLFGKIGLDGHLTVSRRNGFYSMVERIKSEAKEALVTHS
jgi:cysteine desulfuration protein SufE